MVDQRVALVASSIVAIIAGTFVLIGVRRCQMIPIVAGLIALLIVATFPLAAHFNLDRAKRSSYPAAMALAERFPPGTVFTTGQLPMDQPELFYYSHMQTESYPSQFAVPKAFPNNRWVLLTHDEYAAWSKLAPDRLTKAECLWPYRNSVYLAWYMMP
jgi:hypothetical protein